MKICVAALFTSHPDPQKLRQQIAEFTSLEMIALSGYPDGDADFKDKIRTQLTAFMDMIVQQIPKE